MIAIGYNNLGANRTVAKELKFYSGYLHEQYTFTMFPNTLYYTIYRCI